MRAICVIICFGVFWQLGAQNMLPANPKNIPVKETLLYRLKYKWGFAWLNAGEVTFKTKETISLGKPIFEFSATGRTYSHYNSFFKVNDYFESRVDKNSFEPLYFKRNISEGKYKLNEFDMYNMDSLRVKHHNLTHAKPKIKQFNIQTHTRDLLSLIYYIRSVDMVQFEKLKSQTYSMFIGGELLNVKCSYLGLGKIEFNNQEKSIIKIGVSLVKGEYFPDGETMILYVSNDSKRIPYKIESPLRVGKVEAELLRVEN